MKVEMCEEFFYRVENDKQNLFNEFNSNKGNVLRNNEKLDFYCGEWVKVKVNNFISHHVKPMENLTKIANIYNTNIDKIKNDNNLNSSQLFIGQVLKIFK